MHETLDESTSEINHEYLPVEKKSIATASDSLTHDGEEEDDDSILLVADKTPISKREIWGWNFFGFATEGYAGVGTATFFPIILQSLATNAGHDTLDPSKKCTSELDSNGEARSCSVTFLGASVDTTTFVLLCTVSSVVIQFFLFISLGALADFGNWRKTFLIGFASFAALGGICILFVTSPDLYWLGGLIFVLSNAVYGASYVFFYAWVPILTRMHPEVLEAKKTAKSKEEYFKAYESIGNFISSRGFMWGYVATVLELCIGLVIQIVLEDGRKFGMPQVYPLQMGIAFACIWMMVFLVFPWKWLKPRPGPPLPSGSSYITVSFRTLRNTLSKARKLKQLFRFLLGWFIYSDGFSTIASVAILFVQDVLKAGQTTLIIAAVITPFAAGVGAVIWFEIQKRFKLTTKQVLIIHCIMYSVLPLYGLLGFVTPKGTVGLRSTWEIYPLAAYHGFLLGATQSACRVFFSELIPHGKEAEFFALYEVTDKGSAWIGPLLVALIKQLTRNLRYSFIFLFFFLALPVYIFSSVDPVKGKEDAHQFFIDEEEELKAKKLHSHA